MKTLFTGCALSLLLLAPGVSGYSVLTHEAIIDSLWDGPIQKLLLKRFPASTPEDIQKAHAYVYGGCIIQDMGYYPFSSRFFSDLTHYVGSGDFVASLIRESQDVNEYAFALGALAHYAADNNGHRIATNLAVPILYPKLRQEFGKEVTYWESPLAHLRTEFGFDVLQVAQGRYAPDQYKDFVGFEVSKPVLERAFLATYGIEMKDIFHSLDLALGTYRYSVGSVLPTMTRVAWRLKKNDLIREIPGTTQKTFLYNLSRASYEKQWGRGYARAGFGTRLITWVIRVIPKFGPFRSLPFKTPTPEVEKLFMASFNATVNTDRDLLGKLDSGTLALVNDNLDSGEPAQAGDYTGSDITYAKLLDKLAEHHFEGVPAKLRLEILAFYSNMRPPVAPVTQKMIDERQKLLTLIQQLQAAVPPAVPEAAQR